MNKDMARQYAAAKLEALSVEFDALARYRQRVADERKGLKETLTARRIKAEAEAYKHAAELTRKRMQELLTA